MNVRRKHMKLDQARLKELLDYDPDTGIMTRKITTSSNAKAGDVIGSLNNNGYLCGRVDGKVYLCHRLAWLWMTGQWPTEMIDHLNRRRTDNRWSNLREATHRENAKNHSSNGFCWDKEKGRWISRIQVDGRMFAIGRFETILDARAAYLRERKRHFGEFA